MGITAKLTLILVLSTVVQIIYQLNQRNTKALNSIEVSFQYQIESSSDGVPCAEIYC